jgi:serine protease DegS
MPSLGGVARPVGVALLAFSLAASAFGQTRVEELDRELREIVSRVLPSVVRVDSYAVAPTAVRVTPGDGETRLEVSRLEGRTERFVFSGMTVLDGGYVVTVPEAVANARSIVVRFHDGREIRANPVGVDRRVGVAVLEVRGAVPEPPELGEPGDVEVGSLIVTVGNPFGLAGSPALGMVSGLRSMQGLTPESSFPLIQISAPVNPGDYGGAVADARGRIVGMIVSTFRASAGGSDPGPVDIHFALPVRKAIEVAERIVASGGPARGPAHPWLGVRVEVIGGGAPRGGSDASPGGLRVIEVVRGGPADRAGILRHDILRGFDGAEVASIETLWRALLRSKIGQEVRIELLRDGKPVELELALEGPVEAGPGALPEELPAPEAPVPAPRQDGDKKRD